MAEYKCHDCHLVMDADEDDLECPVCGKQMQAVMRKKNCSLRPSEQLRGISAG